MATHTHTYNPCIKNISEWTKQPNRVFCYKTFDMIIDRGGGNKKRDEVKLADLSANISNGREQVKKNNNNLNGNSA